MKTRYSIISMRIGEIQHEELGPIMDKDLALDILELFTPDKFHLAYVAYQEFTELVKLDD